MKKCLFLTMMSGLVLSSVHAQSVTVGASGADYTSLNAAIVAVGLNVAEPDVITVIDEGPFIESRIVVNAARSGTADLTIQASPGLRPIFVISNATDSSQNSAVYLRKSGNLTFKDLVIIPTTDFTPANMKDVVGQAGIEISGESTVNTSVTLQNLLISSNDGTNHPIATLDGLTSPTFTPGMSSFRDEGVYIGSLAVTAERHIYMTDVVVSGVAGDQGSDAFRGFVDGSAGSEWIIGPGCVASYNNYNETEITSGTARACFQPGGTSGLVCKVIGTEDKPVKFINNNLNGFSVTNSAGKVDGLAEVKWCIIANNSGAGLTTLDGDSPLTFENVTFANNGDGIIKAAPSPDEAVYTFSNVIAAGNGGASNQTNIIYLVASDLVGFGSTFAPSDSAIVLNGPNTLNNVDFGADGIESDSNWVVTPTNVTSGDPQFLTLDPTSGAFAAVSNPVYGTAGPGGGQLVGGGTFAATAVGEWQLY